MKIESQEELKKIMFYDQKTGNFYWRISPSSKILPWAKVGTFDKNKYVCIVYKRHSYKAHRLAWLYVHGKWPNGEIDHINNNPSDNAITNLRDVSRKQNEENKPVHRDNISGFKGVTFDKRRKNWFARIMHNGKQHHLGSFCSPQKAHEAYKFAAINLHTHNYVNKESV